MPNSSPPPDSAAAYAGSRWVRSAGGSVRRSWRRSLQLRMVTYTLLASTVLVGGFAVLVASEITNGLIRARVESARSIADSGQAKGTQLLAGVTRPDGDELPND